jgi:sulfur-oxidizing protein SoxB
METYFKSHKTITTRKLNTPKVEGMQGNPGIAA